jgi:hypothetical protein
MNIKEIENQYTKERYYLINDRYAIYIDGCIYDTKHARDIPAQVFKIRDNLINSKAA